MQTGTIGIIGGSGFYSMPGLTDIRTEEVDTPFGKPLDPVVLGRLGGRDVAFIARHGKGHRVNPTHVNARANIFALKKLGVTHLVSISAVGSMKEEISPGHLVVPDQLIDRTIHRPRSFFDGVPVVHVALDEPYCPRLREALYEECLAQGATAHQGGTYICIEGPQFSTRAESMLYRSWGVSVIGMTASPEARLAREAEMCYVSLAMATDYDTWHPHHDSVTVDAVVKILQENVEMAKRVVASLISTMPDAGECRCDQALRDAIMTPPEHVPDEVKRTLQPLLGKYMA